MYYSTCYRRAENFKSPNNQQWTLAYNQNNGSELLDYAGDYTGMTLIFRIMVSQLGHYDKDLFPLPKYLKAWMF